MRPLRGFPIHLPQQASRIVAIEQSLANTVTKYAFDPIILPVVEPLELFVRSKLHSKELFAFNTVGGEHVALRPEATAPVARIVADIAASGFPSRLWYCGHMFRYERPQKGRFRQFTQFGVEAFGDSSANADVEVLHMAQSALVELGLHPNQHFKLMINSIGSVEDRERYCNVLKQFLQKSLAELSEDSRKRLAEDRVLRILDSKDTGDRNVLTRPDFPSILDHMDGKCLSRFKQVLQGLDALKVPYELDPLLVRGLDYYSDTTFEFVAVDNGDALGRQQSTLLAGGRYDNLVKELGSAVDVPGIGWAAGVERLATFVESLNIDIDPKKLQVAIIAEGDARIEGMQLAAALRQAGVCVVQNHKESANIKKQLKGFGGLVDIFIFVDSTNSKYNLKYADTQVTKECTNVQEVLGEVCGK